MHPRIVELHRHAAIPDMSYAEVYSPNRDAVFVTIERTGQCLTSLIVHVVIVHRSDALVEDVAIAHEGEVVATVEKAAVADTVGSFEGDVEVVALLRLQVWITDEHIAHITHIEVHIHLLERRCPEAAGVVGTEGHPRLFIHQSETFCEGFLCRCREVVVSDTTHHVELLGDIPVELGIAVDIVLCVVGVVDELIGGEIVVHVVGSKEKAVLAECMTIECMRHMLPIAVVMVVGTGAVGHVVGLVIAVEGVRQLEMTRVVPGVPALQSGTVAIEMIVVRVALTGAEEIAAAAYERQLVGGTPRQSFLHVVGFLPIQTADVRVVAKNCLVVGQSLRLLHQLNGYFLGRVRLGQTDGVNFGMLEAGLGIPFRRVEREVGPMAPFVTEGIVA